MLVLIPEITITVLMSMCSSIVSSGCDFAFDISWLMYIIVFELLKEQNIIISLSTNNRYLVASQSLGFLLDYTELVVYAMFMHWPGILNNAWG